MNNIFILSDIHGSHNPIKRLQLTLKDNPNFQNGENYLILLGDVGANYFFNHRDDNFKKNLGKYNFTYFCIRGNHEQRPGILYEENPGQWHTEQFFGNNVYVENKYPYIKYALDDVSFYNINDYKTLIIPGAYSVDKYHRLAAGWSWFPNEQLSADEMKNGLKLIENNGWKCDLVLSHTCPIIYEPTDLFLSVVDQSMVEKDMERYLGQIEYQLDYKLWCFGHFHDYREYPRDIGIPSYDNPRQLMLFNDYAVNLEDAMTNENLVNCL